MPDAKPTTYTGLSGGLRTSPWLAKEDLPADRPVMVEIEDVLIYDEVTFDAGRKERHVPALKFRGRDKQLVLRTATNRRWLSQQFGNDTRSWRGRRITLYVDPSVRMKGEQVGGIRFREAPPLSAAAPSAAKEVQP